MPDTRVVARVRRELEERMSLAEGGELLELEVLKVFKRPFSTVRILECICVQFECDYGRAPGIGLDR